MENDITYIDLLNDRRRVLTESELQWFESVCNDCLAATGINVQIFRWNHEDRCRGKDRWAAGLIHSRNPQHPLSEDDDTYITIDTRFIHDSYEEKFNGVDNLWFETLDHAIAHELAHLYQWRHCKRHTRITECLYGKIKEYQENVKS